MSKKLILLVHGMGTHPKGEITKTFKQALGDRAKGFGIDDQSFFKSVDYKEFNYSEYFDLIRKQFADNAQARRKGFKYLVGKGFAESLLKQLNQFESNFGKDEFFYTHWLDVILYSTTYFGEKLRVDFIKTFERLRKKYDHKNIHIVCHSLGTALVHDALAKYYRTDSNPFDDIPDLKTGNFNFASLWTFANVSRLVNTLNGLTDPDHSTVVTGADGCVSDFVDIRNQYDPFTWFRTYDRQMDNKVEFVNSTIRKVNTHDFYEYVTEPNVARTILKFIYEVKVNSTQFNKGVANYQDSALDQEVATLKEVVKKAADDPSVETAKATIEHFKKILKKIEDLT